jgi:hypothetical protein
VAIVRHRDPVELVDDHEHASVAALPQPLAHRGQELLVDRVVERRQVALEQLA